MRTLGFVGLVLLAIINATGMAIAVHEGDFRGIGLMVFMAALLAGFAHTLWRGMKLEREQKTSDRLAEGWGGEPLTHFLRNQLARSPEGKVLIAGSALSLAIAAFAAAHPNLSAIGIPSAFAARIALLFGLWPVLAFTAYVGICGPQFITDLGKVLAMVGVMLVPFMVVLRWL
jgi:hypothetical protein